MRALSVVEGQWIFKKESLGRTPSREGGISLEDELKRRKETIENIESLGLRTGLGTEDADATRLRKVTIIASTLVHRFYMRRSFEDFKEKLMAPTILFLASKIDEEPLKLRHIVNACLAKWDRDAVQWTPDPNNKDSKEYIAWERDILAAEEIALDALCFDMTLESPREIIDHSLPPTLSSSSSTITSTRSIVAHAMHYLHQSIYAPLSVLYHPPVIALGIVALVITTMENIYLAQGLSAAAELAKFFDLEIEYNEDGPAGPDLEAVSSFCNDYLEYAQMGLIDPKIVENIDTDSKDMTYTRVFNLPNDISTATNGTNGHGPKVGNGTAV